MLGSNVQTKSSTAICLPVECVLPCSRCLDSLTKHLKSWNGWYSETLKSSILRLHILFVCALKDTACLPLCHLSNKKPCSFRPKAPSQREAPFSSTPTLFSSGQVCWNSLPPRFDVLVLGACLHPAFYSHLLHFPCSFPRVWRLHLLSNL